MSATMIGASGIFLTLFLMAARVPIAVALGAVSIGGIMLLIDTRAGMGIVSGVPFNFIGNWALTAVPMFLLMGYICTTTGMTNGLFRAMRILLSRLPGGLAITGVAASALFAAASGSSVATSSAMARIAVPEMLKYRYDPALASGVIAASGTLGSLIPPSILMVLYGIYAEVSIGKLFIAGFLPGLLSAALYMGMIALRCRLNPALAGGAAGAGGAGAAGGALENVHYSLKEKLDALKEVWPLPVLIFCVLGGIFTGLFSPTEAGAVGAIIAVVIAILRGQMSLSAFREAVVFSILGTSSIFAILIGTLFFTRFLALSGLPSDLADLVLSVTGGNPYLIIAGVAVIYVVLGMFVESIGLMLLTLPIVLPLVTGADMNLIWFGIIVIKLLEIGLVTPPIGLNVYVIKGALGTSIPIQTIFKGVAWFIVMDVVALLLLVMFPSLSIFLPEFMWQ
ncbi:TRAP transporter large permease [Sneathiella chinensis]|uniref:TRAP transporter large permease protein n=1 Tax=Sneathiella chinensis TaxID=349750 RepID=A0ABQ5U127_9PROT|nr:TRAP transporter large permease subunit [Sneathiella chinensis]GLQ05897.1 C4-dicarboxylate ABC transporter [Sneathiella chinensis]